MMTGMPDILADSGDGMSKLIIIGVVICIAVIRMIVKSTKKAASPSPPPVPQVMPPRPPKLLPVRSPPPVPREAIAAAQLRRRATPPPTRQAQAPPTEPLENLTEMLPRESVAGSRTALNRSTGGPRSTTRIGPMTAADVRSAILFGELLDPPMGLRGPRVDS